jgi:hypothetical protein
VSGDQEGTFLGIKLCEEGGRPRRYQGGLLGSGEKSNSEAVCTTWSIHGGLDALTVGNGLAWVNGPRWQC